MKTTQAPMGQLKAKTTKSCSICGCKTRRALTAPVYGNTPEEIKKAEEVILAKAEKAYTCRICKSIATADRE